MKKSIGVILCVLLAFVLSSCGGSDENANFYDEFPTGDEIETVEVETNPVATITLEDGSEIVIELSYYTAPNTVADFIAMAQAGAYDGMAFNEVRNDCIVMLGSVDGEYNPPYYVMDELSDDDNEYALSHTAGVVSMIRTSSSNTSTGRFFILTEDQTHFDNLFTSFGTVTSGMDVIEAIAEAERDDDNMIVSPYVIKSVDIKTYGVDFPNPTIIPNDAYNADETQE
ncbi:MAG: peptidylprolyl isomerase [Clostridiales bacterium]|nr:peptidylprolyl isomerase [Clostridiales bacterium]